MGSADQVYSSLRSRYSLETLQFCQKSSLRLKESRNSWIEKALWELVSRLKLDRKEIDLNTATS